GRCPGPARHAPRRRAGRDGRRHRQHRAARVRGSGDMSHERSEEASMSRSIADRAAFDLIRYASVWEDADVLCEALAPVARGGRLLSIASAGDNALALLTLDPAEVVAVDLSAA